MRVRICSFSSSERYSISFGPGRKVPESLLYLPIKHSYVLSATFPLPPKNITLRPFSSLYLQTPSTRSTPATRSFISYPISIEARIIPTPSGIAKSALLRIKRKSVSRCAVTRNSGFGVTTIYFLEDRSLKNRAIIASDSGKVTASIYTPKMSHLFLIHPLKNSKRFLRSFFPTKVLRLFQSLQNKLPAESFIRKNVSYCVFYLVYASRVNIDTRVATYLGK